jgi:hypothetical protein
MKRCPTIVASILFLSLIASGNSDKPRSNVFDRAECLQGASSGQCKSATAVKGTPHFDSEHRAIEFRDAKGAPALRVDFGWIESILYEQTSTPGYAEAILISPLFILSSSKKHFLTVQFKDEGVASQYAIFRLGKRNRREAIAAGQTETGKAAERVEQK